MIWLCCFVVENQVRMNSLKYNNCLVFIIIFMYIHFISLFPELYKSFLSTSLIQKAQEKKLLFFSLHNPREFCENKHQQIDDQIYWWWDWMLIKAKPIVDCVESVIRDYKLKHEDFSIVFPAPAKEVFNQKIAYWLSKKDHIIFVSWRYEGIDYRCEKYLQKNYPEQFKKISLWSFIVLWWETPSMVMTEAIVRLIPWVIKEKGSRIDESYSLKEGMENLEAPNYTRPAEVFGMKVPDELLTWDDEQVKQWRKKNQSSVN